jgi:hypothetical protein
MRKETEVSPSLQVILVDGDLKTFAYYEVCDRCEHPERCPGSCKNFESFVEGKSPPQTGVNFMVDTNQREVGSMHVIRGIGIISWKRQLPLSYAWEYEIPPGPT